MAEQEETVDPADEEAMAEASTTADPTRRS